MTWLEAEFAGGRHAKRLEKIEGIEGTFGAGRSLRASDPAVYDSVRREAEREEDSIVLIASENYASQAVLEAQGSVFTNKYAEGYPKARYYGGCANSDDVEQLAIDRAKELFGAEYANVQPLSGSSANMAAYFALLEPGDKIVSMALAHGGHLTHGASVSFSGKLYDIVHYGVEKETGLIDYDKVAELVAAEKPKAIVAGASSYSRTLDFKRFREIADSVGAYFIMDMAHIAGLIAGGAHPSPVPYADLVTSTTHKTLRGPRGGMVLGRAEFGKAVDKAVFPGLQGGPLMHTIAAKAVAFAEAMRPQFKKYAANVVENAIHMADYFSSKGFNVVSGGTDNHLFMLDLSGKGITGADAETALDCAAITLNKNSIPFDTKGPNVTSGIRIGTPILTTRGMGKAEMITVADLMIRVLENMDDETVAGQVRDEVSKLCRRFPFYAHLLAQ
jgi:glycine hydroxymethyltransferase